MGELKLAYTARSYSTGTLGRSICSARSHHFVADDLGGEEVGAGELFFSGVAACAVNMVERIAAADETPLEWMDVSVEAYRDPDKDHGELTLYDSVRVRIEMWGVSDDDAEVLTALWKARCPLYGTVAAATPDTTVTLVSHTESRR